MTLERRYYERRVASCLLDFEDERLIKEEGDGHFEEVYREWDEENDRSRRPRRWRTGMGR